MENQNRKRKAEEQLSPYSGDPVDPEPSIPVVSGNNEKRIVKKAIARKRNTIPEVTNKEALKGIFGKVSLSGFNKESKNIEKNELIAGLNKSFLKAVKLILEKQSDKNLTYIFKQYKDFIDTIERNEK